jgi:hypothetical protein
LRFRLETYIHHSVVKEGYMAKALYRIA